MTRIEPKLFKKYDVRGRADGDSAPLSVDAARLVGQAFGAYVLAQDAPALVVIGRDNRDSSAALSETAVEGLVSVGCDVLDIGMCSTPMVYWHAVQRGNAGGMMITGSHLPPDQNGFKLSIGARNLYGAELDGLRDTIERDAFPQGMGHVTADADAFRHYLADIVPRVTMTRSLDIVVDAGSGTAGLFAPRVFEAWGHHVTRLYCEPDGQYPHHQPDPQNPDNMRDLAALVRETGADIGIAFDGDADRMGAVDEHGDIIAADRLLALLARDMLSRHPGATVVADVLSSQVLFDEVAKAGGVPVMWASGHSLVKAKMVDTGALLGGEMSGHIFLAEDYYGFDDAYLAAGRLLNLIGAMGMILSQLDSTMPTLYSTPEYRPHCPDDAKQRVIDGVRDALAGQGDIVAVDGIRVKFARGWGILRASNTEPVLSLRFEGETEADALDYRDRFVAALRAFPEVEAIQPNHP